MAQVTALAFGDVHIERVALAHIVVIKPRSDYAQPAQIAAMLVRIPIIRVVLAHAHEGEGAFGLAIQEFLGDGAHQSIGAAMHALHDVGDVLLRHGMLVAIRINDARAFAHAQDIRRDIHQINFRSVVTGGPVKLCRDNFRARRHLVEVS